MVNPRPANTYSVCTQRAAVGGCRWPAALQHLLRIYIYLFHHTEHLSRLKCTIHQEKDCSATSENGIHLLYMPFPYQTGMENLPVITHHGVITLHWDSTLFVVWTHTCIFMLLLVKEHTDTHRGSTCANRITYNISLSLAHKEKIKLINLSTCLCCRHSRFKLIISLFILCQYTLYFII